jgi:hypothetical protein
MGPVHARARLNPQVVFGPRGCWREGSYTSRDHKDLHSEAIYVCARDERCIRLVELIDVNKVKKMAGKRLEVCRQNIDQGDPLLIAAICTLWPAFVLIVPTTFDTDPQVAIGTISATRYRL